MVECLALLGKSRRGDHPQVLLQPQTPPLAVTMGCLFHVNVHVSLMKRCGEAGSVTACLPPCTLIGVCYSAVTIIATAYYSCY